MDNKLLIIYYLLSHGKILHVTDTPTRNTYQIVILSELYYCTAWKFSSIMINMHPAARSQAKALASVSQIETCTIKLLINLD